LVRLWEGHLASKTPVPPPKDSVPEQVEEENGQLANPGSLGKWLLKWK